MTIYEVHRLATYYSEVSRGIVHTPETEAEMRELQRRFDDGEYRIPRPPSFWQRALRNLGSSTRLHCTKDKG